MREITSHKVEGADTLGVFVRDEKGHGNANHDYLILQGDANSGRLGRIRFQNGPIKEHGINGVSDEVLLAILIDRLEGFQAGDYACPENAVTLANLQAAMQSMLRRTKARVAREVEGTSVI